MTGEARPEPWQVGVALAAFAGAKAHSAYEQYELSPIDQDTTAPPPATCIAYQDAREERGNECIVRPERHAQLSGGVYGPWTIRAEWDGNGQRLNQDVEQHPEARTVVAFDAGGSVVAWWDGMQRHSNGRFATE